MLHSSGFGYNLVAGIAGSVLCSLSCLMQSCGFDPPVRRFLSGSGDFYLRISMGSDSISPRTLLNENINRGLVCVHKHSIVRTQKTLTFMF